MTGRICLFSIALLIVFPSFVLAGSGGLPGPGLRSSNGANIMSELKLREMKLELWEKELELRERELNLKTTRDCSKPSGCAAFSVSAAPELVFSDDFDTLDFDKWQHELTMGGGGSWEFEYYTNNRTNSFVRDGKLFIKPTFTADNIGESNLESGFTMDMWGSAPANLCTGNAFYGCSRTAGAGGNIINPIQSARLRTSQSFNMKYGRVEVRAQLPKGDWLWPAIWMVPSEERYGAWPASGEIDIMESRGNARGYSAGGVNTFGSTLHWGPHYGADPYNMTHSEYALEDGDFSENFHTFGLYWDEDVMYTYLDTDDNRVLQVPITESFWAKGGFDNTTTNNPWEGSSNNNAPFDQSFFLILNVAVGGVNEYFPDTPEKPWVTTSPHAVNDFWNAKASQWGPTWDGDAVAMQVDSVKVWQ